MPQQSVEILPSPSNKVHPLLSDKPPPFRLGRVLLGIFGLIIVAAIIQSGGSKQKTNSNPRPKETPVLSPELKKTAENAFHALRRQHFRELMDLQERFKTPDPPDWADDDRPADAVTMDWKGRGRMVDLTIRNDNGYDVKNVAVVCFLPNGSATMRIMPGSIPARQTGQFSGDFGADTVHCLILTAAR